MSGRDLDAAGIAPPDLRQSYELCRRLNSAHGKTYYLATLLLPPAKRPYVHALYGLARYADEFVDSLADPQPEALLPWGERLLADLRRGRSVDPVGRAAVDTLLRWDIPVAHVEAFLTSMAMDLTVRSYRTYEDLRGYMYGSAAVIGLQMVPILEPLTPLAYDRARALGEAFQLTNFIRDVAEDVQRGRIYVPLEDLDRFAVSPADLALGYASDGIRNLIRFEVERCREIYAYAAPGVGMLHPTSRDCIRTALILYGGILDEVENAEYDVFSKRVSVPLTRRLAVALPGMARAARARREAGAWHPLSQAPAAAS